MIGIYIHIPFCRSRCIYCGFYSTTSLELRQRYVETVVKEIGIRSQETGVRSIYLGGGTPSQLTIPQLQQIFDAIFIYNKVEKDAEVTIEVNPDDVTETFAEGLATLPVNRVSMGAQTFDDVRLKFLHRRHTSSQVRKAVSLLRSAGISNISVDLMYGFPNETISDWGGDIDAAIALDVEHLSAYCLTIEEETELWRWLSQKKGNPSCEILPDEELERAMYEMLIDKSEAAGFEHYEISNFAKPGFYSRHNSSYWDGTPYLGIGAAAHSYDGNTRSWNIADIHQYIEGMEDGKRIFESETLDADTRYNDMVTVALRTRDGLDLKRLSEDYRDYCLRNAQRFLDDGQLQVTQAQTLILTRKGLFVSDMIMSELMKV